MRRTLIIAFTVLLTAGCTAPANRSPEDWIKELEEPDPKEAAFPEEVSLIRLIANPREYDGRYIRVYGYLHMEFERDALFIHREDCEQWLEPNSVDIGISKGAMSKKMRGLSDRYVFLEGKFYYRKGDEKGTLWRVTRTELAFGVFKALKEEEIDQPPKTPSAAAPPTQK